MSLNTNLLLYYTMGNISGSTLIDETGNYNGTIVGATQDTQCGINTLDFENNVNARVSVLSSFASQISNTMTLSFNFKRSVSGAVRGMNTASNSIGSQQQFSGCAITSDKLVVYGNNGIAYTEVFSNEDITEDCLCIQFIWNAGVLSAFVNNEPFTFPSNLDLTYNADRDTVTLGALVTPTFTVDSFGYQGYTRAYNRAITSLAEINALNNPTIGGIYPYTDQILDFNSGTGSMDVATILNSDGWTASSDQDWLTITSGSSGTGDGTIDYSYTASTVNRTANITISFPGGNRVLSFTQEVPITIDPTGSITVDNTSQSGSVTVTADSPSTTWTASSNVGWIIINSGSSGTGDGTIEYSINANNSNERVGQITVTSGSYVIVLEITQEEFVRIVDYTYTQYNNAPKLNDLINQFYSLNSLNQYALEYYNNVFNLDTAIGTGLDFWGIVLNQSRVVRSFVSTGLFGFGTPDLGAGGEYPQNFDNGNFGSFESNATNTTLGDDDYRRILKIRYRSLTTNNSIASISDIINEYTQSKDLTYFCLVKNEDRGVFSYNFNYELSAAEIGMFLSSRLLPAPAGYDYIIRWNQTL